MNRSDFRTPNIGRTFWHSQIIHKTSSEGLMVGWFVEPGCLRKLGDVALLSSNKSINTRERNLERIWVHSLHVWHGHDCDTTDDRRTSSVQSSILQIVRGQVDT